MLRLLIDQHMDAQQLNQWDRSFNYQQSRDDINDAYRTTVFDENKRQFGVTQEFRENEAKRAQGNFDKTFQRADTWRIQDNAHRDRVFNREGQQFDDLLTFRENEAKRAQGNFDKTFDRAGEWRIEDHEYRDSRDAVGDKYRTDYFGFQQEQARQAAASRDASLMLQRDQQRFDKWYKGEYLKHLGNSLTARRGGGSGGGSNLDSNTVKTVENIADSYAKTFMETGHIPVWFDRRVNPVEQMQHFEAQGAQMMTLLMNRFPGDPVTALQYLPSFWGRLMTAGENGEYGDKVRKRIHDWKKDNPDRIEQETAMFKALQYGALKSVNLAPELGESPYSQMDWEHQTGFTGLGPIVSGATLPLRHLRAYSLGGQQ